MKRMIMRNLILAQCLVFTALMCSSCASPNFDQTSTNALASANKQLLDAAAAHGVSIQIDRMSYANNQGMTIVHAPITGIEKYGDADFASGAPVQLMIIKSTVTLGVPNGSYVVKAQHQPGATSGKAIFTDRTGKVAAQRDLIVRTREQLSILFPDVYTNPPSDEIPIITSTHIWTGSPPKLYVDCSGWHPQRTLYYSVQ